MRLGRLGWAGWLGLEKGGCQIRYNGSETDPRDRALPPMYQGYHVHIPYRRGPIEHRWREISMFKNGMGWLAGWANWLFLLYIGWGCLGNSISMGKYPSNIVKIGFKLAEIEDFRNHGYFCPPLKNGPSRSPEEALRFSGHHGSEFPPSLRREIMLASKKGT